MSDLTTTPLLQAALGCRWIPAYVVASVLVMVGIFAMRCIMVIGGLSVPLS
jgi:hypothetical protein